MQTRFTLILSLLLICSPVTSFALSGNQSGHWTVADSPVIIDGETTITAGTTLTIDPGVSVLFTGPHMFIVNGTLLARGTAQSPIIFTRAQATAASRWSGIRFIDANDASILEFCIIEHVYKVDDAYRNVWGGGVHIDNCSPTVQHCTIRNNYSRNDNRNGLGGAIHITGGSTSLIDSNHLVANTSDSGGAICVTDESWPVISNNVIENNTAYSSGGGIYIAAWAEATIESNVIRNNRAYYWGGGGITLWNNTCSTGPCMNVMNNVITGNQALQDNGYGYGNGGGIYCRYNKTNQFNNTIYGNSADGLGGGVYVLNQGSSFPTISNSVIRNNSAPAGPQIALVEMTGSTGNTLYSEAEVYYSNIEGGWTGTGSNNIDAQPLFANPAAGHFLLLPGSRGIDEGDSSLTDLPTTDILGTNRIVDGDSNGSALIDMGAFEYNPTADIPADINNSKSITLADTILLLQLITGRDIGLTEDRTGIDINRDSRAGLAEALFSLQHLAQ